MQAKNRKSPLEYQGLSINIETPYRHKHAQSMHCFEVCVTAVGVRNTVELV